MKTIRALGREHDKAFELLGTLTADQHKTIMIDHAIEDLVCGPEHPNVTLQPQGVLGSDMTDAQRTLLFEVAREWAGLLNDAFTVQRMATFASRCRKPDSHGAAKRPTRPTKMAQRISVSTGPSLLI